MLDADHRGPFPPVPEAFIDRQAHTDQRDRRAPNTPAPTNYTPTEQDPWKHRSQGMQCGTCMWFVAKVAIAPNAVGGRVLGRCRRHAPTMSGYPVVFQNDFCGDHKLDEGKL